MLRGEGYVTANGAEQAVPGMAVMFVFFLMGNIGISFFQERYWGTWQRIRSTHASDMEIVLGKVSPYCLLVVVQQVGLLVLGHWLFGLDLGHSVAALTAVAICLAACISTLGVALATIARTQQQMNAVQTVGMVALAGIGGLLSPAHLLPYWARVIAPATPTYWAMQGYQAVLLRGGQFSQVALPCAILVIFSAAFGVIISVQLKRKAATTMTFIG